MDIACDGCATKYQSKDLTYYKALGHVMRYCATCAEVYLAFKTTCEQEGARLQRLLDLFEDDVRGKVPLLLVPTDLPRLMTDGKGDAVTLA